AIVLGPGRDKSLKRRHPWIFSGAIEKTEGDPQSGDTVLVKSAEGKPLALAGYSTQSQIRARVWDFDVSHSVDKAFFEKRIRTAIEIRHHLPAAKHSNAL